jgi:phenol/toluene 2-monooxygenase (NADH) P5/A5
LAQKPRECRAEVAGIRWPRPEIIEVDLRMVEPPALDFEAGQWISVPFGPKTVRAWSMLSSPTRKRTITLSVDVAPGGMGSQWLRALKPGDPVEFKGPTGGFVFNRADPRRAVFVAEEIGIVPVRSILADLYETGYGRPTILIYWARDPSWLVYDVEFRSLARRYPGFTYVASVRAVPAGWRGETGEAAAVVDRLVHSVDKLVVYVCGGGDTVNAVRDALVKKGMDRKSVKWEKFW